MRVPLVFGGLVLGNQKELPRHMEGGGGRFCCFLELVPFSSVFSRRTKAGLWIFHVESSLVDVGCSFCVVDGLTVEEVVEALPFTCTDERERERGMNAREYLRVGFVL